MKWMLLLAVLGVACVIGLIMLQRIAQTQQKLAALHDDLRHNERRLQSEMKKIEAQDLETQKLETPQLETPQINQSTHPSTQEMKDSEQ